MAERQITAQELYDSVYEEVMRRNKARGTEPPDEVEIFKKVVKMGREAVANGDAPTDFLYELAEVQPIKARERFKAKENEEFEQRLREGKLDLSDIVKLEGLVKDEDGEKVS